MIINKTVKSLMQAAVADGSSIESLVEILTPTIDEYIDRLCLVVTTSDYEYSNEWASALLDDWCLTRAEFLSENVQTENFVLESLRGKIISRVSEHFDDIVKHEINKNNADTPWDAAFTATKGYLDIRQRRALREALEAIAHERSFDKLAADVMDLVPKNLLAEFYYIPGWSGFSYHDDVCGMIGLEFRGPHTSAEDVIWNAAFANFLRFVNVSGQDFANYVTETSSKIDVPQGFDVAVDPTRPAMMTAKQAADCIDNSYRFAVPLFSGFIPVLELFNSNPTKDLTLTIGDGKLHIGLWDFTNGAGYMDSHYCGKITIPATSKGVFGNGASFADYGVDQCCGLVRSKLTIKFC